MHKDRLLKLADLLETDANNPNGIKFDLERWILTDTGAKPKIGCGTAACAVGLACISPEFRSEGLHYKKGTIGSFVPAFGGQTGWAAVEDFFELEDEERAWYLFSLSSYEHHEQSGKKGELAVAKRIRDFVDSQAMP